MACPERFMEVQLFMFLIPTITFRPENISWLFRSVQYMQGKVALAALELLKTSGHFSGLWCHVEVLLHGCCRGALCMSFHPAGMRPATPALRLIRGDLAVAESTRTNMKHLKNWSATSMLCMDALRSFPGVQFETLTAYNSLSKATSSLSFRNDLTHPKP